MRGPLAVALLCLSTSAAAETELKNDSFQSGQTAGVQQGFVAGEMAASRFVAPATGRQLLRVQFFFGGNSQTKNVTFKVWDDSAGTDAPGSELFSGDYMITGSDTALQEINLSGDSIVLTQQFRVGLLFQHDGLPSVARDVDNSVTPARNFLYTIPPNQWWKNESFIMPIRGDWIIRAFISDSGGGGGADAGVDAPTGTGGACNGNADCPAGQFCDTQQHACTFECRTNGDCGPNGTCSSLGQCLAGGDGGGCCQTDHGGEAAGIVLLGFGVLLVIGRRRAKA